MSANMLNKSIAIRNSPIFSYLYFPKRTLNSLNNHIFRITKYEMNISNETTTEPNRHAQPYYSYAN